MKSLFVTFICVLLLGLAVSASATLHERTLSGTVDAILGDSMLIMSEEDGGQQMTEVRFDEETNFGDPARTLNDFEVGDAIIVAFEIKNGDKFATSIILDKMLDVIDSDDDEE